MATFQNSSSVFKKSTTNFDKNNNVPTLSNSFTYNVFDAVTETLDLDSDVKESIREDSKNKSKADPLTLADFNKLVEGSEKTIDEKMKKAIQFMNLQNGMLFIQSIVKDNVIMPYDIGFRLSGTQEHVILEAVCGYNPLKLLVNYALTGKFGNETLKEKINPHFDCVAAQITFLVKPATISKFKGIEDVEKMPQVIRIIKNKQEGETIPKSALGTLNQVALRIFVKEQTTERLNELIDYIRNQIKIISNDNEDIVIK